MFRNLRLKPTKHDALSSVFRQRLSRQWSQGAMVGILPTVVGHHDPSLKQLFQGIN